MAENTTISFDDKDNDFDLNGFLKLFNALLSVNISDFTSYIVDDTATVSNTSEIHIIWLCDTHENAINQNDNNPQFHCDFNCIKIYNDPDECVDYITTVMSDNSVFLILSNTNGYKILPLIHELPQLNTIQIFSRALLTDDNTINSLRMSNWTKFRFLSVTDTKTCQIFNIDNSEEIFTTLTDSLYKMDIFYGISNRMYKPDSTYNIWFIELIIQKEKREKSLYENTISNIILGYILYYMNEYDSSLAWFKGIAPSIIKFHVTEGPNSLICSYLYKYCKLFKYLLIKCTNPINLDKKYIETYMEQVYPIHYDSFYILSIIYQSRFDFKSSVEIILYSINIYIQLCLLRDKDMNYIANVYEYLAVLYIDKHRKILNTDIRIMAIKLFLKSLKIHATIHPINKAKMITIYSSIARLYFELKYYGLSIYYCDKAIEYCLKTLSNLSPYLADLYVFRGCTSGMLYKITKERNDCLSSLNDLKKAVQLEIPDVERLARAHFNISVTYGNLREWGLALSHLQNILSFSFQSNENLIIETYRFMGKSHMEIKNYDIAIDNYEKILQLLSPDGHLSIRGEIFLALGLVYKLKSDYEQSLKYFYLAMDIYNTYHVDINDPCFEIIYRHLSEIYKTENKNEIAQDFSDKAFNEKTRLNKLNIFSYPDFKPCAFTVYLTTSVLQDFINDETLTKELTRLFGQT